MSNSATVSTLLAQSEVHPLLYLVGMAALAALPFFLIAVTSFVKLNVVFGILRNAIGAQQVPSGAISALLAIVLSLHIMAPVGAEVVRSVQQLSTTNDAATDIISTIQRYAFAAAQPIEVFLRKHAHMREREFFSSLREQSGATASAAVPACGESANDDAALWNCSLVNEGFFTLVPAFVISELQEAFVIGFTLFLPFLIVDLVVANVLIGLGMMMVSPVSIALPFKLLLFIACDGWYLLCRGLVLGYS